jgi:hypothetical protein
MPPGIQCPWPIWPAFRRPRALFSARPSASARPARHAQMEGKVLTPCRACARVPGCAGCRSAYCSAKRSRV